MVRLVNVTWVDLVFISCYHGGGEGNSFQVHLNLICRWGNCVQLGLISTVYFISNFTARHVRVTKTLQVSGFNLGIETI